MFLVAICVSLQPSQPVLTSGDRDCAGKTSLENFKLNSVWRCDTSNRPLQSSIDESKCDEGFRVCLVRPKGRGGFVTVIHRWFDRIDIGP